MFQRCYQTIVKYMKELSSMIIRFIAANFLELFRTPYSVEVMAKNTYCTHLLEGFRIYELRIYLLLWYHSIVSLLATIARCCLVQGSETTLRCGLVFRCFWCSVKVVRIIRWCTNVRSARKKLIPII